MPLDSVEQLDLQLRMRDGVHLATTVFLPAGGEGPWPVLLERTPYGRLGSRPGEKKSRTSEPPMAHEVARQFCSMGYAVAVQDCRGRYDSEGCFRKYSSEANDSFDTIAALTRMDWCDGRVGTFGQSYSALVQTAVGPLAPAGLVAQIIDSGGFANAWRNGLRQNGVVELKQAVWIVREAARSPSALQDPDLRRALLAEDLWTWLDKMPWTTGRSPLAAHPDYESSLLALFDPNDSNTDWRSTALATEAHLESYARVPILFLSSWYDPYSRSISEIFRGLRMRQPCNIVLGPWTHCDHNNPVSGDVDFGPEACLDHWSGSWVDFRARFLDAALRRVEFDAPRVSVFLMGGGGGEKTPEGHLNHGGRWITTTDWPMPGTERETLYFTLGGNLTATAPTDPQVRSYTFDPRDPVPTIGGDFSSFGPYLSAGAFDQVQPDGWPHCRTPGQRLADRPDVCVFRTAPLVRDIAVAGGVEYEIEVSTDAEDTDFALKLIDEYPASADYPDGYAMLIGDTILRLSHVEGRQGAIPGRVICLKGTLCWTANRFAAGHRIRVDISSSNFPKFDCNRNTGDPVGDRGSVAARNRLHMGGDTGGCRIHLPILPEDYWT